MELTVYWTRFAENKLEDIFEYYKFKANVFVAEKLVNGLLKTSIGLVNNPKMGQIEGLIIDQSLEFRYLIHKNYKLIYLIDYLMNQVEIVNIFDCRQNPEKINEIHKSIYPKK
nr:type II toxin-antitoxin system RelE/ParE family toxin [Pseudopedobacter sp.]